METHGSAALANGAAASGGSPEPQDGGGPTGGGAAAAPPLRLPVHVREGVGQLTRAAQQLHQALEREPAAQELAEALHLSSARVRGIRARTTPAVSLDTPSADGWGRRRDVIAGWAFRTPLDAAIETALSDHLRRGVQALTPREAYLVRARFGLDTGAGRALEKPRQAARQRRLQSVLEH